MGRGGPEDRWNGGSELEKDRQYASRAALYVRVSTTEQAAHDLSIPDQIKQAQDYCASRGFEVVEIFEEPGASAVSDRRPQFRRMMEMATWTPAPFDLIIVHSYSRFFRDHFELEAHIRALNKNGVKLVSITQTIGDDPMAEMMRHIIALFDEYQSRETGKHVRRTQRENARQGFWNGSVPPVGYRAVIVERRGLTRKRKLEIDPLHADTIRLIYRLALHGSEESGPLGVTRIASYLNDRKILAPGGGHWGLATVYRVLRRRTYTGELVFNERGKGGRGRSENAAIRTAVPQIIDRETFEAVQILLDSRRGVTLPIGSRRPPYLLQGMIYCGKCGARLSGQVGGTGYRSYACAARTRHGPAACGGLSISGPRLDEYMKSFIQHRLLHAPYLVKTLGGVIDRHRKLFDEFDRQAQAFGSIADDAGKDVALQLQAVEEGLPRGGESSVRERIAALQRLRDEHRHAAERARQRRDLFARTIARSGDLARIALETRERLQCNPASYRHFAKLVIEKIKVREDKITIMGSRSRLLAVLTGDSHLAETRLGVSRRAKASPDDRFLFTMSHELKTSRRKVRDP